MAKKNGVYLEITTRRGHAFTNGHVVKMAKLAGAKLLLNSDSHSPDDILTPSFAQKVAQGAGLSKQDIAAMYKNAAEIVTRSS
jgi:histidinol phosphatase-like PHP family hydrolase